jgi:acyl carrier protein
MTFELTEAQELIFGALQDLNAELPEESRVALDPSTALFGVASTIDSLSLISVIVDVEAAFSERLGRPVFLTDDEAMSQEVLPFQTVSTLATYMVELSRTQA